MKIEVDSAALNKLEAMVQQLQDERDMLFDALQGLLEHSREVGRACGWSPIEIANVKSFAFATKAIAIAKGENNAN